MGRNFISRPSINGSIQPKDRLLYSYRVDDRPWSPFMPDTVAHFTGLDPGDHVFQVRAMDRNWNIERDYPSYPFTVLVPWYREPGFLIVLGIGSITIMILAGLHIRHHRRVEGLVRERTTELQSAYDRLLVYQDQLRALAEDLSRTEERERRSIATDLHDTIGQALSLTAIRLQALRESIPQGTSGKLREIHDLIERTIEDSRSLMFQICPPVLYELGLTPALEQLAKHLEKQRGIHIDIESDNLERPITEDMRFVLFRAVRELLVNTAKHAGVQQARVQMQQIGGEYHIRVEDEGVGFDVDNAVPSDSGKTGFGLFSIRERLRQLGGRLEIESSKGRGTRVTIIIPLSGE